MQPVCSCSIARVQGSGVASPSQDSDRAILGSDMVDYVNGLIATGDYPQLAELASTCSTEEIWSRIAAHMRDRGRFDRNLARILDGFEADFAST